MNPEPTLPHIDFLEYIPLKENLDNMMAAIFGPPYFGEAPFNSSPLIYSILVALFLLIIALVSRWWRPGRRPSPLPGAEMKPSSVLFGIVESIFWLMVGTIGRERATRFFPLIGTLALFIFISNILGLLPGIESPTSNLNVTLACAIIIFFTTHYVGVKEHGNRYITQFFGPLIAWYALPIMMLFFIIELIGQLARPLSLSIRLFGNIMADHAVVAIFLFLIPILVPIPIMVLGLMVAFVQTLVFSIISMVYISIALEQHEEEEGEAY